MRGKLLSRLFILTVIAAGTGAHLAGCRTSTRSGLPDHIRTVEVHVFQNKTMFKSLEAEITRRIIDRINADARIRVVNNGGDAVITGEITQVKRTTIRETTTNEPGTVLITVEAEYSFYDQVKKRFIIADAKVLSTDTGMSSGLYEVTRESPKPSNVEISAAASAADEIVRRTIGMW